ncbi:hypothetical protein HYALB_00002211 [Hymenoscyphus albidus]|uniref:Uncharacterized protein n=1 Tax=Hymenoscyphus albidus TaxID=595503 RepID=A0A9N9LI99_9HELO|nr:hypothetical protein HYALB_00002211 [Hymenoscyphus albidus]
MPVEKEKRKPQNAKSLKANLDAKARLKDKEAICSLIQTELEVGGTATYKFSPKGDRATVALSSEEKHLVFIIGGGFTVGSSIMEYVGNGLGHSVYDEDTLTLAPGTVLVIISGY